MPEKPQSTSPALSDLQLQAMQDSDRWFPDTSRNFELYTLAMVGEAGEVANVVKKIMRGSKLPPTESEAVRHELAMELVDVYVYLLLMSGCLGIDLGKAYDVKRVTNEQRFSNGGGLLNGSSSAER